ncbi:MAG TPA: type II toxin-antitoxin system HicA family toxin [Dehalococcoidia bacterium]|nr:type II toxin-antitoxin system HicA family toxin [Dehalococcoidia bacterium]
MSSARTPRNIRQQEAIRALVRAGGVERRAKGGHRAVTMANGHTVPVPSGRLKTGTLNAIVKQAGLTMGQFIDLL